MPHESGEFDLLFCPSCHLEFPLELNRTTFAGGRDCPRCSREYGISIPMFIGSTGGFARSFEEIRKRTRGEGAGPPLA